jgi:DNA-3-methyladenine glycosylase
LLGHFLLRKTSEGLCGGAIVETEAYLSDDPASHGYGRKTPRNQVMYGLPGRAYVYFIYGNHWCFNTVCQPPGIAEGVLVRAVEPLFGKEIMAAARKVTSEIQLTNGPGKLCQAMKIDRELDGANLSDPQSQVFIARNPDLKELLERQGPTIAGPRIGLTKAAHLSLRFYLAESPFVSRRAKAAPSKSATDSVQRRIIRGRRNQKNQRLRGGTKGKDAN